jgi:ectoine hydroxylase-related dioxygenase (phytanoyl-CoA dioxygenase family)
MRVDISLAETDSYRTNGFVLIEDFLTPDELEQWRQVTEEAVQQRLETARAAGATDFDLDHLTNGVNPDSYWTQTVLQCVRLSDTHTGMARLMRDPRLGRTAATLADVSGIRIWHDMALFKPPWGNPTAWHLDNPFWSFFSRQTISMWVPLDDVRLANGCLWFLPGTHKTARFDKFDLGPNFGALFQVYPEWRHLEAVPVPCPAGSAIFLNGLIAHAAGPNMTPYPRRALNCSYMPDGSTFNGQRNILPEKYFRSLQAGDVLDNEEQNPLVWRA